MLAALVAGQYAIAAPAAYAWHDPEYVSPPPGEIVKLQLSKVLRLCIGCPPVLVADVGVWGFQHFDAAAGLCFLRESWDCAYGWGSVMPGQVTHISARKTLAGNFTAVGVPLWQGTAR
ncbi:MAG: hypothetical protein LM577_08065, partial [Thermoproteaceae archaeon]|nr:hypothetical protein [Thermoproteaceae archaeon]